MKKCLTIGGLFVLMAGDNFGVAYAQYSEDEGGVYEISTDNPETSGANGMFYIGLTSMSITGLLILRK